MSSRLLWMVATPGVTGEIVEAEARALGFVAVVPAIDVELSRRLAELSTADWLALRKRCLERIGHTDPDAADYARIRALPAYADWKRDLHRYQERHGITQVP